MRKPDHQFLSRQNSLNKIKLISRKLNCQKNQKENITKEVKQILQGKKYYTGFSNLTNRNKFHLFEEKNGEKALCGRKNVKSSGWCRLQKLVKGFLLHNPISSTPTPKTYVGDYCNNCINKMQ